MIAAKGAPEAIADLCHLDAEQRVLRWPRRSSMADRGRPRVLAVARARLRRRPGLPVEQHDFDFEFLGLVGLHDPVRAGGAATPSRNAGRAAIRVVMITGDYPGTALTIAREIGLDARRPAASPAPSSPR